MAFSLSPSVQVVETNLAFNVVNLPSARTGFVVKSDTGPAYLIKSIPDESELEILFNQPTVFNFKDWFNGFNFLQYASSLFGVRPIDQSKITKNKALALDGGDADPLNLLALSTIQGFGQQDLYNGDIAEVTIPSLVVDSLSNFPIATFSEASGVFSFTGANNFLSKIEAIQLLQTGTTGQLTQSGSDIILISGTNPNFTAVWSSGFPPTGWSATLTVAETSSGSGQFVLNGTVDTIRLAFYRKWVTSLEDIGVAVCSNKPSWKENVSTDISSKFNSFFEFEPNFAGGEFAIIIFQKNADNTFTDREKWIVSYNSGSRDSFNRSNFVEEVLLTQSKYIYGVVSTASGTTDVNTGGSTLPLFHHVHFDTIYPRTVSSFPAAAYDPNGHTQADIDEAFDLFSDPETFDINILMAHENSLDKASNIANTRKDCIAIVGPHDETKLVGKTSATAVKFLTDEFGTVDADVDPLFTVHDTYSSVYGNLKYQFDKFNDTNRWMPLIGDIAGLYAETDLNNDPWFAPAGLNRGIIRNVIKLAFNPNKAGRDSLYINSINPVITVPGEGTGIVFGQKTATSIASAFDRVNIRRLLITIEKALTVALRPFMFEFNDTETRDRVKGVVNPFLAEIKARRGLFDFLTVVDATNNTAEIIDQNALVVDVFLKPTKVAEFIRVNVIVTRTGTDFTELAA